MNLVSGAKAHSWIGEGLAGVENALAFLGGLSVFAGHALRESVRRPLEFTEILKQVFEIGWRSAPLIVLSGLAVGSVLSMHTRSTLERFGAESMIPTALAFALVKETGPLVTGLLVSGRVGAGIGAELGGMRVTEQIDALESLAVGVDIFSKAVDGTEMINIEGKHRLDEAMTQVLTFPRNGPLMIEGFTGVGARSQQYLQGRRRAALVEAYLVTRFHLRPAYVGLVSMGADSNEAEGGRFKEGVGIVSFYK